MDDRDDLCLWLIGQAGGRRLVRAASLLNGDAAAAIRDAADLALDGQVDEARAAVEALVDNPPGHLNPTWLEELCDGLCTDQPLGDALDIAVDEAGHGPSDWVGVAVTMIAGIDQAGWNRSAQHPPEALYHRLHCAVLAAWQTAGTGEMPEVLAELGDPGPET